MSESRCGILCSACPYLQDGACRGCTGIAHPFWADACPVKDCAEGKGLEHCGLCAQFPCELLHAFAYHPGQGDDGKRIAQCRAWANKVAQ